MSPMRTIGRAMDKRTTTNVRALQGLAPQWFRCFECLRVLELGGTGLKQALVEPWKLVEVLVFRTNARRTSPRHCKFAFCKSSIARCERADLAASLHLSENT